MQSLFQLLNTLIDLYIIVIIAQVILSWLVAFGVVNMRNQFAGTVGNILYQLTEPVFGRIRRYLPDLGGLDLSPLVVLLGLVFLQNLLREYWPI